MLTKNIFFLFTVITFYSCKSNELLPGYVLNTSPNSADKPGRVYRLDSENKTDILVKYLDVNPTSNQIYISEKNNFKTINTVSLISFVSKISNTGAFPSINSSKNTQFRVKFNDTQVIKMSDEELRPHYSKLVNEIKNDISLFGIKKPQYFIVREAITATEILISFTKKTTNKADLKANFETFISGNGNVQWTNDKKDELNLKLKKGTFIFYKPEKISFSTSITGETKLLFSKPEKSDLNSFK